MTNSILDQETQPLTKEDLCSLKNKTPFLTKKEVLGYIDLSIKFVYSLIKLIEDDTDSEIAAQCADEVDVAAHRLEALAEADVSAGAYTFIIYRTTRIINDTIATIDQLRSVSIVVEEFDDVDIEENVNRINLPPLLRIFPETSNSED